MSLPTPYYQRGPVTLYHGDCLELLPSLPRVDAVVTDPPYFLPATHYQTRKSFGRSLSDVAILEYWLRGVFSACASASKASAVWYVFCDGQSYAAMYVSAYPHVRRLCPLVWDKVVSFNGYTWRHQHELILFCELQDSVPVPTGDGDILSCRAVPVDEREHGAEKPSELIERLLLKSTTDGDLVTDPCLGSGTTAIACIRTGRNCIGIELEERYCEIAAKRCDRELNQGRLQFDVPKRVETQRQMFAVEADK